MRKVVVFGNAGAGAHVQLLRLADYGIHGNGHGMIFERNHLQVLDVVMEQLDGLLASGRAHK